MVGPPTGPQVALVGKVIPYLCRPDTPGLARAEEPGRPAVPAVDSHGYPRGVEKEVRLAQASGIGFKCGANRGPG